MRRTPDGPFITLTRGPRFWSADFRHAEGAQEVYDTLGSYHVEMPYRAQAEATVVLAAASLRNPGHTVRFSAGSLA